MFREETEMLDRIEEFKSLRAQGHIQSYSLTLDQDSLECTLILHVPSPHFSRPSALLHSLDITKVNYITLSLVFERPCGAPMLEKFSVKYSSRLATLLGSKAPKEWNKLFFRNVGSFVWDVREEVNLQVRELEQQWHQRTAFILDVYSAFENIVGFFYFTVDSKQCCFAFGSYFSGHYGCGSCFKVISDPELVTDLFRIRL